MDARESFAVNLREARRLAQAAQADVDFVESDLHGALDVLPAHAFRLVYTGIVALCRLPRIREWARIVATLLTAGGRLFIREAHPMLWALDESRTDALVVGYPHVETAEPLVFDEPGTYVATDHEFTHTVTDSWNHGLGEIMTALLDEGMTITRFVEHDSVPWNALPGQMELVEGGEWRLADRPGRLAHTCTLEAVAH